MCEDGKRTWKAVLYALEKEVYAIIPRSTKANEITPTQLNI
jgi:hypothetical protein